MSVIQIQINKLLWRQLSPFIKFETQTSNFEAPASDEINQRGFSDVGDADDQDVGVRPRGTMVPIRFLDELNGTR